MTLRTAWVALLMPRMLGCRVPWRLAMAIDGDLSRTKGYSGVIGAPHRLQMVRPSTLLCALALFI